MPTAELMGWDVGPAVIEERRATTDLNSVHFEVMDVLNLSCDSFDVVTANAVNLYFEPDDHRRAISNISATLRHGGAYVAYEWVCPGSEEHGIIEKTPTRPKGLRFFYRSENFVSECLRNAGFTDVVINLKAAALLGLQVPPILLARADELIE